MCPPETLRRLKKYLPQTYGFQNRREAMRAYDSIMRRQRGRPTNISLSDIYTANWHSDAPVNVTVPDAKQSFPGRVFAGNGRAKTATLVFHT